jgi:hypothetical protein
MVHVSQILHKLANKNRLALIIDVDVGAYVVLMFNK